MVATLYIGNTHVLGLEVADATGPLAGAEVTATIVKLEDGVEVPAQLEAGGALGEVELDETDTAGTYRSSVGVLAITENDTAFVDFVAVDGSRRAEGRLKALVRRNVL